MNEVKYFNKAESIDSKFILYSQNQISCCLMLSETQEILIYLQRFNGLLRGYILQYAYL